VEDIRTEERNVRLRSQGVLAAAESARLNKEVYEGEKRRLENDLSTPFKVRETLRNYLDAVDVETRARLDLELSRVALAGSQGVLLDAYGFESLDVTSELGVQPPPIP
ncbi:MAG: hypothetical protein VX916_04420, partial [Planctomycetota bacterium]|nr:hypothetical protein [Planctomycetota bacterium]